MLNASELALLATELTTDPSSLGYGAETAVGSDSRVLALVTDRAKGGTLPQPIACANLILWATSRGVLSKIVAGTTSSTAEVANLCLAAQSYLNGALASLDLTNPVIAGSAGFLEGLVNAGIFTANAASGQPVASGSPADLLAFASVPASRADVVLGYGVVPSLVDVAVALRG